MKRVEISAELLAKVPAVWHSDFKQFVETGTAPDRFLQFVDSDVSTQEAVEAAFAEEVRSFERFAEGLNIDADLIAAHVKRTEPTVSEIIKEISNGLLKALATKPREQKDIFRAVGLRVVASRPEVSVSSEFVDGIEVLKTTVTTGK